MNRGSTSVPLPTLLTEPRFNEAPIHESGKSWSICQCEAAPGGLQ